MDDIASQLNALLNSPEGMEQIKNVANMLGQSAAAPSSSSTPQNQSQQQGGLGGLAGLLSQPGLQETLSGLLGGGNQAQPELQNALSGLLGGGGQSQPGPAQNPLGGIDPGAAAFQRPAGRRHHPAFVRTASAFGRRPAEKTG